MTMQRFSSTLFTLWALAREILSAAFPVFKASALAALLIGGMAVYWLSCIGIVARCRAKEASG